MERVDGAYDHFSRTFSRALDGYVDSVVATERDADAATDAVTFLTERATSGNTVPRRTLRKAAVELQRMADKQSCE